MATARWSDLPKELLELIFECLKTDCLDLLRCRRVCIPWRSIATQVYRKLKPLIPPLLLLIYPGDGANGEGDCCVFDAKTNGVRSILSSEERRGRWCCSSSHGWLLTVRRNFPHECHLLNPFTKAQIELPLAGSNLKEQHWLKAITSTSPSNPDCMVLVIHSSHHNKLTFCKTGDQWWTNISCYPPPFCCRPRILDGIFYKDQFYVVYNTGDLVQCVLGEFPRAQLVSRKLSDKGSNHNYLVESISGDLLLVTGHKSVYSNQIPVFNWDYFFSYERDFNWDSINNKRNSRLDFGISKWDWSNKEWSCVENLGDQAIFLSYTSSISVTAASHSKDCRADCIYYITGKNVDARRSIGGYFMTCNNEDAGCSTGGYFMNGNNEDAGRSIGGYHMETGVSMLLCQSSPIPIGAAVTWVRPDI